MRLHCPGSNTAPHREETLKVQAKLIGQRLGIEGFSAADGWLGRVKKRNKMKNRDVSGECADVADETVATWTECVLPGTLKAYRLRDMYKIDDLGLFINLLPDKSVCLDNERNAGKGNKAS